MEDFVICVPPLTYLKQFFGECHLTKAILGRAQCEVEVNKKVIRKESCGGIPNDAGTVWRIEPQCEVEGIFYGEPGVKKDVRRRWGRDRAKEKATQQKM